MCLQSDGSDRKKNHGRPITGASAVDECQTMFAPKIYSSAVASLSENHDVYSESLFPRTNNFYLILIMLNVIRTEP